MQPWWSYFIFHHVYCTLLLLAILCLQLANLIWNMHALNESQKELTNADPSKPEITEFGLVFFLSLYPCCVCLLILLRLGWNTGSIKTGLQLSTDVSDHSGNWDRNWEQWPDPQDLPNTSSHQNASISWQWVLSELRSKLFNGSTILTPTQPNHAFHTIYPRSPS